VKIVNKNIVKKVILILSVIALLSIVLGGCTITGFVTIPIKGTVYITVDESYRKAIDPVPTYPYHYYIFMDGGFIKTIESGETLVLHEVSLEYHTFEARDVSPYVYCYGSVTQRIYSGTNYVTIYVSTY
jgi:hypothetical protein